MTAGSSRPIHRRPEGRTDQPAEGLIVRRLLGELEPRLAKAVGSDYQPPSDEDWRRARLRNRLTPEAA